MRMIASWHVEAPRRHVARVALVSGRIGEDERAPIGGEEPVRDVDRDALLALRLEAVGQEGREIDLAGAGGADLLAVALHGGELVLVDHLRVVQQPADERAFAVVDAAAGEEAEELLLLVAGEVAVDVFLTQINGLHDGRESRARVRPIGLFYGPETVLTPSAVDRTFRIVYALNEYTLE